MSTDTALIKHERGSVAFGHRGIEISTLEDAFRMATAFHKSGLAPRSFASPEAIFVALQAGAELGLSPFQSLQILTVISGKVGIGGDGALALVKGSPVCEYVKPVRYVGTPMADDFAAEVESRRVGDPEPLITSFSVGDAKLAGLWGGRGPWQQYPKRMLYYRALGFNLRDNFPDVLRGIKTAEELSDYPTRGEVQPFPSPVSDVLADPVARTISDLITPKQCVAVRAVASKAGVDADKVSLEMFGHRPEELTKAAASQLIDRLKSEDGTGAGVEIRDVTPPATRVRQTDPLTEEQANQILVLSVKLGQAANDIAGRDVMGMTAKEAQAFLGELRAAVAEKEYEARKMAGAVVVGAEVIEPVAAMPVAEPGAPVAAPESTESLESAIGGVAADRRDKKGRALAAMGHVSRSDEGFEVTTAGRRRETMRVWRDQDGRIKCSCAEFVEADDPKFRCEHILAVKYYLEPPAREEVERVSNDQRATLAAMWDACHLQDADWGEFEDCFKAPDLSALNASDVEAALSWMKAHKRKK